MKKSLLLGSAAALVAVSGAQAADLPVVEPVEYVRVCDAFGSGFHYIPGTETCLKFSGRVRAEIGVKDNQDDDENDTTFLNSNFELVVNASSMTEIGMLVGQFAISGSNEGNVELGDAWITIGENILVGRETSRYDFGGGYGMYDGLYTDESLNQFTFIMPFGNGVSMTLGLEDGRDRQAKIFGNVVLTGSAVATSVATAPTSQLSVVDGAYAGMEVPEIVASLRVSQGWGSAQISAAAHQIRSLTTVGANQVTDEEFGFAVQAGAELNVGSMTKIKLVGAYADGAGHYIGGGSFYEADVDTATGEITDTLDGWYVLAGLSHDFSDNLSIGLTGSYHEFENQLDLWQVGGTVTYEVVENLLVRVGAKYEQADFDTTFGGLGAARTLNWDDEDNWEAKLRIQRDF